LNYLLNHRQPSDLEIKLTQHLLNALNKCPPSPGIVHRGLINQATTSKDTQYVEGKYVIWVSFASCSRKPSVASAFSNDIGPRTLFKIDQKSGKDIAPLSVYDEEETLICPNTVFKVVKVTTKGDLDIVELKEIIGEELLCLMECLDSSTSSCDADNTPWTNTSSFSFLHPSEING